MRQQGLIEMADDDGQYENRQRAAIEFGCSLTAWAGTVLKDDEC